jgi:hypothetical protein
MTFPIAEVGNCNKLCGDPGSLVSSFHHSIESIVCFIPLVRSGNRMREGGFLVLAFKKFVCTLSVGMPPKASFCFDLWEGSGFSLTSREEIDWSFNS